MFDSLQALNNQDRAAAQRMLEAVVEVDAQSSAGILAQEASHHTFGRSPHFAITPVNIQDTTRTYLLAWREHGQANAYTYANAKCSDVYLDTTDKQTASITN